ncbi:hypothetical protein PPERSA_05595 [Pseudocohnilembus persalinus]|uniref:EF-hand domain-containing protein n=1 Tax=Pseudocohnilembus persalinus TaxID=266149 RepID=A0A0V0Q7W3_PSEPJ|nr:hypothetical protein PPERSA_05595 [Pseudocohnilembus persalinus]|eukprot:KRW98251.1 hypothetical protein PPERSA_05595 [Pseudocohnilembus persalinus]
MLQRKTVIGFCEILKRFGENYENLDLLKQEASHNIRFEPYAIWQRINREVLPYIDAESIYEFMNFNGYHRSQSECQIYIKAYDREDYQDRLDYQDFAHSIIPQLCQKQRTIVTQRKTYKVEADELLDEDLEKNIAKIIDYQINILQKLGQGNILLMEDPNFKLEKLFEIITKNNTQKITMEMLQDFFHSWNFDLREDQINAIFKGLDRDQKGYIDIIDLKKFLKLQKEKKSIQNTQKSKKQLQQNKSKSKKGSLKPQNKLKKLQKSQTNAQIIQSPYKNTQKVLSPQKPHIMYEKIKTKCCKELNQPLKQKIITNQTNEFMSNNSTGIESQSYYNTFNSKYSDFPNNQDSNNYDKNDYISRTYKNLRNSLPNTEFQTFNKYNRYISPKNQYQQQKKVSQKQGKENQNQNNNLIYEKQDENLLERSFGKQKQIQNHIYKQTKNEALNRSIDKNLQNSRNRNNSLDVITNYENAKFMKKNINYSKTNKSILESDLYIKKSIKQENQSKNINNFFKNHSDMHSLTRNISPKRQKIDNLNDLYSLSVSSPKRPLSKIQVSLIQQKQSLNTIQNKYPLNKNKNEREVVKNLLHLIQLGDKKVEDLKNALFKQWDFNMIELFKFFDQNQENSINFDQFCEKFTEFGLNHCQKEAMYLVFKKFDKNGNKKLTFGEFATIFLPQQGSDKIIRKALQDDDKHFQTVPNHIIQLFSTETREICSKLIKKIVENESKFEESRMFIFKQKHYNLKQIFQELDQNQDGYIDQQDLLKFLTYFSKKEISLLFNRFDQQGVGKINYKNFLAEIHPSIFENPY